MAKTQLQASRRVIDSHQHVFWWNRDDAGLVADMDAHGIDLAWLLTWEIGPTEAHASYRHCLNPAHAGPDGSHPGIPLSDLLKARDRFPNRFEIGYCPHPLHGHAPELLRAAAAMHGVRVCGEWKFQIPFDDPRCIELFRTAGELKMPVVLHLGAAFLPDRNGRPVYQKEWYGDTVENLERAMQACPDTVFIGHAPGFWREISGDADVETESYGTGPVVAGGKLHRLFDHYPNLFGDLSALSGWNALNRDVRHARSFLSKYADRLLFGRDEYGDRLQKLLLSLDLEDRTLDLLMGENAGRLLNPCPDAIPVGTME